MRNGSDIHNDSKKKNSLKGGKSGDDLFYLMEIYLGIDVYIGVIHYEMRS
jgi:hypothetical protein